MPNELNPQTFVLIPNLGMQRITKKIVLGVNKDYYDSLFLGKIFEVDFVTGKSNIFLKKQK